MAASTAEERALTVLSAIVLAPLLYVAIHRLVREGPRWQEVRTLLRRCARVMCRRVRRPRDEAESEVIEKLQAQRIHHMRLFYQSLAVLLIPFTVEMLVSSYLGEPRAFTFVQDLMTLVAQSTYGAVLLFPASLNRKTADALYFAMGAATVIGLLPPFCDIQSLFLWKGVVGTAMTLQSCTRRDFASVATFRLAYLAAACSAISVHWADSDTLSRAMVYQIGEAAMGVIIPCLLDAACYEIIKQGVEINSTKELLAAASALLKAYCDAVVEVTQEGVIAGNPQDLSALLLRGDGRCLRGRRFADLLAEEAERQHFADSLSAPLQDGQSLASTLTVGMRDANGSLLRSQVMWFPFFGAGGAQRYMLGVRELQAGEERHGQISEPAALTHGLAPQVIGREVEAEAGPRSDATPSPRTSTSAASSADSAADSQHSLDAMLRVSDSLGSGFLVQHTSQGFLARVGRVSTGAPLLDYVEQRDAFSYWLMMGASAMVNADSEDPEPIGGHTVTLIMPHGRVRVECALSRLCYPEPNEEGVEPDFDGMELSFSRVRSTTPGNSHHRWRQRGGTVRL